MANLFLPVSLEKENYVVGTQIQSQAKQEEHEALRENSSERTWSEGRSWVVGLGILTEGLQICSDCKKPLKRP